MKAVGVIGYSDAGKTTLIERLVPAIRERGRVATVKAIHHDVEVDEPGKDTYRHRLAGAEAVIGVTPSLTFTVERGGKRDAGEAAALRRCLSRLLAAGYDYVLVEGFAGSSLPKLVVGDAPVDGPGRLLRRIEDVDACPVADVVAEVDAVDPWSAERG